MPTPQSILYWKTGKMQEIFMNHKIKTYIITSVMVFMAPLIKTNRQEILKYKFNFQQINKIIIFKNKIQTM